MTSSLLPNSSTVVFTVGIVALLYIVRWLADKGRYDLNRIPSAVSTPPSTLYQTDRRRSR